MKQEVESRKLEALFVLFLSLYLGVLFINQTELIVKIPDEGQTLIRVVRYLCYFAFFAIIIRTDSINRKHVLTMMAFCIIALMCVVSSTHRAFLVTIILCIAAYGCNYRKIIECYTVVYSIGLLLTIILCYIGILENQVLSIERNRYNLGFNWVTLAPIYLLFITIGVVNLRRERITLFEIALLEGISYFLYSWTDTRLSFLLTTCVLLFITFEKLILGNRWIVFRKLRSVAWVFPFLLCGMAFLIQFLYKPGIPSWDAINKILSGRLAWAKDSFETLPTTIFGQKIQWHGFSLSEGVLSGGSAYEYNNVDCSYFRVFFDFGIAGLITTLIIYAIGIYKASKINDQYLVFSFIVVLVFCLTEQWIIELSFNPFVLIAAASFSNRQLASVSNKDCVYHCGDC